MTMLGLTRTVPRHTITVRFTWIKRDFMLMSDKYREIRKKHGLTPMDACNWCRHKFENDEQMALAGRAKGKNWLLCQSCAALAATRTEGEST